MADPPETAVDIVAQSLATVPPNERLRVLSQLEERARETGDLTSLRVLKRYRATTTHRRRSPLGTP